MLGTRGSAATELSCAVCGPQYPPPLTFLSPTEMSWKTCPRVTGEEAKEGPGRLSPRLPEVKPLLYSRRQRPSSWAMLGLPPTAAGRVGQGGAGQGQATRQGHTGGLGRHARWGAAEIHNCSAVCHAIATGCCLWGACHAAQHSKALIAQQKTHSSNCTAQRSAAHRMLTWALLGKHDCASQRLQLARQGVHPLRLLLAGSGAAVQGCQQSHQPGLRPLNLLCPAGSRAAAQTRQLDTQCSQHVEITRGAAPLQAACRVASPPTALKQPRTTHIVPCACSGACPCTPGAPHLSPILHWRGLQQQRAAAGYCSGSVQQAVGGSNWRSNQCSS